MEPVNPSCEDININLNTHTITSTTGLTKPLSKKQLKRLKRQLEWESKIKDIRKTKKKKLKEKKRKMKITNPNPQRSEIMMKPRKARAEEYLQHCKTGIKVIMDCRYEDLMNEREITSMAKQLAECYSINKKAKNPFDLIFYDVQDKLYEALTKNNLEKWLGIKVYRYGQYQSFDDFIKDQLIEETVTECHQEILKRKEQVIYLTADSENEVKELNQDHVYIIGGLVDRNRFKEISFKKAKELGISHGKLPIGEYLKLNSSKVLTTNHVFSILSYFNNTPDWKEAFMSIIPKRKLEEGK